MDNIGKQAVFVSQSGTIGTTNSFTGYQAYIVGSMRDYTATQSTNYVDFGQSSYAVWATLDDDNSCVRSDYTETAI